MGTLGPKYILFGYRDPLGLGGMGVKFLLGQPGFPNIYILHYLEDPKLCEVLYVPYYHV